MELYHHFSQFKYCTALNHLSNNHHVSQLSKVVLTLVAWPTFQGPRCSFLFLPYRIYIHLEQSFWLAICSHMKNGKIRIFCHLITARSSLIKVFMHAPSDSLLIFPQQYYSMSSITSSRVSMKTKVLLRRESMLMWFNLSSPFSLILSSNWSLNQTRVQLRMNRLIIDQHGCKDGCTLCIDSVSAYKF